MGEHALDDASLERLEVVVGEIAAVRADDARVLLLDFVLESRADLLCEAIVGRQLAHKAKDFVLEAHRVVEAASLCVLMRRGSCEVIVGARSPECGSV